MHTADHHPGGPRDLVQVELGEEPAVGLPDLLLDLAVVHAAAGLAGGEGTSPLLLLVSCLHNK